METADPGGDAGPRDALGTLAPEVAIELRSVIDRALSFGKSDRWGDAEQMTRALIKAAETVLGKPLADLPRMTAPRTERTVDFTALETLSSPVLVPPAELTQRLTTAEHEAVSTAPQRRRGSGSADRQEDAESTAEPVTSSAHDSARRAPPSSPGAQQGSIAAKSHREHVSVAPFGPTGRTSPRVIALAGLLALIGVGGLFGWRRTSSPRASTALPMFAASSLAPSSTGENPSRHIDGAPEGPSIRNPQALVHYAAAAQAWDDAASDAAAEELEQATEIEPTFAAAHLRCVLGTYWLDDRTRAHYQQAVRYRSQLDRADAQLLNAYEPMLLEVPDIAETIQRLQDVTTQFPDNMVALRALEVICRFKRHILMTQRQRSRKWRRSSHQVRWR